MYKYFSELGKLKEFKTYLARPSFDKNQDLFIRNITFSNNILKKLGNLFPKLNKIDKLIVALNEDLMMKTPEYKYNLLSYEAWLRNQKFFYIKKNVILNRIMI